MVAKTNDIYRAFLGERSSDRELTHGYSFGGHPVACAAALATIRILQDTDLISAGSRRGAELLAMLRQELSSYERVANVRGLGMMLGVEIASKTTVGARLLTPDQQASIICREARARGLIVRNIGRVIPIMPPLVLTQAEAEELCSKLASAIKASEERRTTQ